MAERSRVNYKSTIDGSITTNGTGAITGAVANSVLTDTKDSAAWMEDFNPITASGTDTYTCSMALTLTSYSNGRFFLIKFTNANTGAATLNVNSLGAVAIKKDGTTALVAGDIGAGTVKLLGYDGTNFQLVGAVSSGSSSLLKATRTISTAEVLTANASPIEIIAAPGAGYYLHIMSASMSIDYNSAAYATNTDAQLLIGSSNYITFGGFLAVTADTYAQNNDLSSAALTTINQNMTFKVPGGNPTAGNSAVKVKVYYSIESV